MPTWDDFAEWAIQQSLEAGGRKALRRRWTALRNLAGKVAESLAPGEIESLLGKPYDQLDPEHNDLKALVAYGAGKGLIPDVNQLQRVLTDDAFADPLQIRAG